MEEREEAAAKMDTHQQLFKIQEALNRVSRDSDSSAIKALLELRKSSSSANPLLFSLSQHLSELADSVQQLHDSKPSTHSFISFVTHRVRSHEVSRLAAETETELQALIDLETVSNLTKHLSGLRDMSSVHNDEDELLDNISALQERVSRGFDINLQDMLLKSGVFAELQWVLCNPMFRKRVREEAAITIKELVLFNKDVFVGSVLVGGSVKALVSMDSLSSLQVVSVLIKAIKSPLVDELEYCGGILKIVEYLSSDELEKSVTAMDCVMEMGYFGRKEAVETMINGGLIHKLVKLQSLEEDGRRCVARFAVQLEVGEGLRQREKRAFKQVILKKVREACVCDGECATIVAEVLWGSSP